MIYKSSFWDSIFMGYSRLMWHFFHMASTWKRLNFHLKRKQRKPQRQQPKKTTTIAILENVFIIVHKKKKKKKTTPRSSSGLGLARLGLARLDRLELHLRFFFFFSLFISFFLSAFFALSTFWVINNFYFWVRNQVPKTRFIDPKSNLLDSRC